VEVVARRGGEPLEMGVEEASLWLEERVGAERAGNSGEG
jgi:hypothetical protein